jgi:hypothetical protein
MILCQTAKKEKLQTPININTKRMNGHGISIVPGSHPPHDFTFLSICSWKIV